MLNTDKNIGEYLYQRLPELYRRRDTEQGIDYALYRFLQVFNEGGFSTLLTEMITLYDILQVDKMPSEVVPLLGQLLGYVYREDLEEDIQRKIIQNLIELYKRKGTKSVLNFITREFTKYDAKVTETEFRIFKTWSPEPKGIPDSEYVEPHTLGLHAPDENTCHLISVNGKYDGRSVIITFESSEERITLLNNLLVDFLPVYCKLYLQVRGATNKTSYEDKIRMNVTDNKVTLRLNDVEQVSVTDELTKTIQQICDVDSVQITTTSDFQDRIALKEVDNDKVFKVTDKNCDRTLDLDSQAMVIDESNITQL